MGANPLDRVGLVGESLRIQISCGTGTVNAKAYPKLPSEPQRYGAVACLNELSSPSAVSKCQRVLSSEPTVYTFGSRN